LDGRAEVIVSRNNGSQRHGSQEAISAEARHRRILLADDDLEMRKLLSWSVRRRGYEVIECADGASLRRQLTLSSPTSSWEPFDLLISDVRMPGADGLQVIEQASASAKLPPVILITAYPDQQLSEQARRLHTAVLLAKPFDVSELLDWVDRLLGEPPPQETSRGPEDAEPEPPFPLEVVLRHDAGSGALKAHVKDEACGLSRFREHVKWCRVIVDRTQGHNGKGVRDRVVIVLGVVGSPLVVRHDSDSSDRKHDLYSSVHQAFEIARRDLRRWHGKRHRRDRSKVNDFGA
jgi:CheY-like chemotaxis protein